MSEALTSANIERAKRQLNNADVQARLGGVASKLLLLADNLYIPYVEEPSAHGDMDTWLSLHCLGVRIVCG
jgi:hypothetical protein